MTYTYMHLPSHTHTHATHPPSHTHTSYHHYPPHISLTPTPLTPTPLTPTPLTHTPTQNKEPSVTSLANMTFELGLPSGCNIPVKLSKKTSRETMPTMERCVVCESVVCEGVKVWCVRVWCVSVYGCVVCESMWGGNVHACQCVCRKGWCVIVCGCCGEHTSIPTTPIVSPTSPTPPPIVSPTSPPPSANVYHTHPQGPHHR